MLYYILNFISKHTFNKKKVIPKQYKHYVIINLIMNTNIKLLIILQSKVENDIIRFYSERRITTHLYNYIKILKDEYTRKDDLDFLNNIETSISNYNSLPLQRISYLCITNIKNRSLLLDLSNFFDQNTFIIKDFIEIIKNIEKGVEEIKRISIDQNLSISIIEEIQNKLV